jgi:hypothetical protein
MPPVLTLQLSLAKVSWESEGASGSRDPEALLIPQIKTILDRGSGVNFPERGVPTMKTFAFLLLLTAVPFALAANNDIPKGTKIDVRITSMLNSENATPGDQFEATLNRDLVINGKTIAPEGATARGRVDMANPSTSPGNGNQSAGVLIIRLTEIETNDAIYNLTTNTYTRQGHGRSRQLARPSIADTIGSIGHPSNPSDIDTGGNIGTGSGPAALIPAGTIVTFRTTSVAKIESKTP